MKRYRFPLEPVLRVRRIEQDSARAGFITANHGLRTAEAVHGETMQRYQALPTTSGPAGASAWLARRFIAECTADSVATAETNTQLARTTLDERRQQLQEARMRTSALERLDERRREEHALEARRDEDAEVDDLVVSRHGREGGMTV